MLKNTKNIIKSYLFRRRTPRVVSINLTGRCSGKCVYCGSQEDATEEMTTVQILSIIDDLSKLGCGWVSLTGGDPLMRDDLGEILDYIKSKGLRTCISSDGSNVVQKRDIVKKSDYLQLSFDGPREIHDNVKYKGAYQHLVQALEVAKEEKIEFFTLTVITKRNIRSIDFILDTAKKHKFRAFFQPLSHTYFYNDVSPSYLKFTSEELEGAIQKLIQAKNGTHKNYIGDSITVLKHFINPTKRFRCYAGRFFAYIHNNGDVYPCWTPPKIEPLNCKEVGFRRAFKEIPKFSCNSCQVSSLVKMNYMASLDFNTICDTALRILSMYSFGRKK